MPALKPPSLEINDTSPLFPLSNSSPRLTIRNQLEQVIRISGRVFNPFIDAATLLYFTVGIVYLIDDIIYSEQKRDIRDLFLIPLIGGALGLMLSMSFEFYSSYQLDKKSAFVIGKNRYELAKTLHERLTLELENQITHHPHQYFEQWIEDLKQDNGHSHKVKQPIYEFEVAKHYFFIRNLLDSFALTSIYSVFLLTSVNQKSLSITISSTIAPIFLFIIKANIDRIEYKWHHYENQWKELSFYSRVALLVLVKGLNSIHRFLLSTALSFYFLVQFTPSFNISISKNMNIFFISLAIAFIYTTLQLPSAKHFSRCSNVYYYLNRSIYACVQGLKVICLFWGVEYYLASLVFKQEANKVTNQWGYSTVALYSIIGLITAINSFINYQDPDPQMMSLIDRDVAKAREEILSFRQDLLLSSDEETGDETSSNIHSRSSSDSDDNTTEDSAEVNADPSNSRTSLSRLSKFWHQTNENDERDREAANKNSKLKLSSDFKYSENRL